MFTLTKWIAAPLLAFSLMTLTDSKQAEAQHFVIGGGGLSLQFGTPYRYSSYYGTTRLRYGHHIGYPHIRHRSNYGYYDYHRTEIYRHGNHYHVQPGHWGYHSVPRYRRHSRLHH